MNSIRCPIGVWAESQPDTLALLAPDREYTFRAHAGAIAAAALRLEELGVRRGHVLAIAAPPCPEYLFTLMASFRVGAIACPINPRWPVTAIGHSLAQIGCTRLIGASSADLEGTETWPLEDAARSRETPRSRPPMMRLDQPATIVFTSGSSGEPKAALHAYGNHYHNAVASSRNIELQPGDRWLLSLPLYHVAGIGVLFRCMLAGAAVVIPALDERIEDAIARCGVTHVSLVSTQLYRLLKNDRAIAVLKGLKAILLGGSAIPPNLIRQAFDNHLPIYTSYGLTEMASQATTTAKGDPLDALLTSGRPLIPNTVAISEDGEILVRGKTRFLGYVTGNSVETPFDFDGWFATGDLGRFDANGCLVVSGRKDNMFISGGENIQPEEIERALCRIEPVTDAVVVPFEHEEFGNVPVAFIRIETGEIDTAALVRRLEQELPRYKIPRHFLAWPAGLESPGGKMDRTSLAAEARKALSNRD